MNLVERTHGKEMHIYMLVQKHSAARQIVLTHGRKCKTESLKQLILHWVPQFHYTNEEKYASFLESYKKWFPTFWKWLAFASYYLFIGTLCYCLNSKTHWTHFCFCFCCSQVSVVTKYHLGQVFKNGPIEIF